jgi:hypothetical protein
MCPRPPTLQMLAKARQNICKRSPSDLDKDKPNNAPKYKLLRSQKQGRPALVLKAQSMNKKTKRGQIYRPSQDDTKKTKGQRWFLFVPVHCNNGTTPKIRPTPRNFPDSVPLRDTNTRKTPFISILTTAQRYFQDATDQITPVKTPLAKKHTLLCCSFSLVDFITHDRDERRHFGMNGKANPRLPCKK